MPDSNHAACHYSVTVRADDPSVLHMLRGLAQRCESGKRKQIAWGGTKERDWLAAGREVTFRFSAAADRVLFLAEADRLLAAGCWSRVSTNDHDPATRQRR